MKKLALILVAIMGCTWAHAQTFSEVQSKALKGDYQAQRNLAYGYSSYPYKGQAKSPVDACAWRIVIVESGHARVDNTDINNAKVYCAMLKNPIQQRASIAKARALYQKIYKRKASF